MKTQLEAVLSRLTGSGPATPLVAGVGLDGSFANNVLDLRQLQLSLAPTTRAPRNELRVSGRVDLSTPEITKGNLLVEADTLDLTQLYDAFTAASGSTNQPVGTPPSATSSPGAGEPEPMTLPLQFTVEAKLGQVFLHEINLQNSQVTVRVDGGKVTIDPCQLGLNGAPVNAKIDLDLGVKGYAYDLALAMDKVPLEPIANTFSPGTKGQYQGEILVNTRIRGAGLTGASLQKSLSGQAGFSFTNANIQLMGPRARKLLVPIATMLRVEAITKSPINWLNVRSDLGGGNLTLSQFALQSEAFEAATTGVIPIAEVLTSSPVKFSVDFALRRSLAAAASLLPPNTPTNLAYVPLPRFVTINGTLGEPASELNKAALGSLLLQSGTGIAEKLGVKVDPAVGNALQGVGNLLGGQKQEPPKEGEKEAAPKPNLLDLFNQPKKQ